MAETLIFNEQVIAKSSVGIVVYHHEGPCVLANQAAAYIVGTTREQLLCQNFREIASWRDNGLIDLALATLTQGQPHQQEVFVRTTFGVETWLDCQFTPLILHGQEHLLLLFADVSHYRHAQQAMALAKTAAEEANRAKSEFLANMSHEIRTPMNAILGMADLLWESPLAFEQRKYVQVFRSAGETLMGIINDVLDFSKIEAGRMELEEIDINLEEEIETVCTIMAPHAHAKGLELVWRITPGVPIFLRGDPVRLRQILLNLLSNAVKFTKEGEIGLNVAQAPSTQREGEILLSVTVRDTGIGIAPNQLTSIFESFVQADLSMTRRFGGTGLGLAIVKRLVEHMGGQITVESRPGRGSTFCFTVCLRKGTERYDILPILDLKGIRALVVDDTESNRVVLREILEQTGATVVEAGDGQTALLTLERAKAEDMPFHLLLLDVRMPGMDGFHVVECCRAAGHPGVPILMLTSDHREHHRTHCAELGVRRYLVKPARHAELLSAIADALELPEAVSSPPLMAKPSDHASEQALRILLVDDSDDNRLLIQVFLDKTTYELEFAEDGAMALDKLKTGHYDLVLMDVQMPVMDGYSATRAWRAWEREHERQPIPIIALTAYALQEDIDRSSQNTTIINLFSATGGAPIWDTSGARAYTAVNAGYPTKTLLHDALVTDLRVEGFAAETTYAEPASGGLVQPDLTKSSIWLISAFGGPVEVRLPHAADANGRRVTIKKTDLSMNPVTVTETSGPGPDGRAVLLGSRCDHVEVVSNGAGWWIVAGNIIPGNVRFFDGVTGVIALDLGQNFYAISAQTGAVEARLPAPGDAQAAGRRISIKKTDASANAVTVTCVSGGGPDGRAAVLRYQYDSLDVVSNGAAWFIVGLLANYGDVEYIEGVSPITGKAGRSLYTVSAYTGVTEFRLPDPSLPTAVGKPMTIKKADQTDHAVWVTAETGNGPEGRRVILSAQGDYVTVISDGAGWHTIGASTPTVGAAYIEGAAGFWVDTARPLCLVSAWTGQATATLPTPGSPEGWGRQVTIKKVDSSNNPVLVVADGTSGPDGAMVVLGKFGDFVTVVSNGAQWYIASRCYDTPIAGWASPDGGGFNRGVYNSDEISNVGWEYSRDVVNAINYRLLATRDVLRALILDLKMKGIIGD
ncbi:hypothetical protein WCLP8_5530002 [uncultured Gammaproteobacteria bacterium]